MIVAGIGFQSNTHADAIVDLVRQAGARHRPDAIACPAFKDGPASRKAAARLGLELILVAREELEAVQAAVPTKSERALAATGLGSIAEASALAAAGPGARLIQPRITGDGVTCALAQS